MIHKNLWLNGDFTTYDESKISILTHALHYGTAVYEGMRSYNKKIFKGIEHFTRLKKSAELLDFSIPYSEQEMLRATQSLIDDFSCEFAYIRPLAWCCGENMRVSNRLSDVNVAISIWQRDSSLVKSKEEGLKEKNEGLNLCFAKWRRPPPDAFPPQSKSAANYATSSSNKHIAEVNGFDDAITLDCDGNVAEATSSNIFFVKDGVLFTPKPRAFLNGITRQSCIEIARSAKIQCIERDIAPEEIKYFDEAFLTGTAVEIVPIASVKSDKETILFENSRVFSVIAKKLLEAVL